MKIKFVKDYSILLASQETKIYRKDAIVDCKYEDKAKDLVKRGFAVEVA